MATNEAVDSILSALKANKASPKPKKKSNKIIQTNLTGKFPKTSSRAVFDWNRDEERLVDQINQFLMLTGNKIADHLMPPDKKQIRICAGERRNCVHLYLHNTGIKGKNATIQHYSNGSMTSSNCQPRMLFLYAQFMSIVINNGPAPTLQSLAELWQNTHEEDKDEKTTRMGVEMIFAVAVKCCLCSNKARFQCVECAAPFCRTHDTNIHDKHTHHTRTQLESDEPVVPQVSLDTNHPTMGFHVRDQEGNSWRVVGTYRRGTDSLARVARGDRRKDMPLEEVFMNKILARNHAGTAPKSETKQNKGREHPRQTRPRKARQRQSQELSIAKRIKVETDKSEPYNDDTKGRELPRQTRPRVARQRQSQELSNAKRIKVETDKDPRQARPREARQRQSQELSNAKLIKAETDKVEPYNADAKMTSTVFTDARGSVLEIGHIQAFHGQFMSSTVKAHMGKWDTDKKRKEIDTIVSYGRKTLNHKAPLRANTKKLTIQRERTFLATELSNATITAVEGKGVLDVLVRNKYLTQLQLQPGDVIKTPRSRSTVQYRLNNMSRTGLLILINTEERRKEVKEEFEPEFLVTVSSRPDHKSRPRSLTPRRL